MHDYVGDFFDRDAYVSYRITANLMYYSNYDGNGNYRRNKSKIAACWGLDPYLFYKRWNDYFGEILIKRLKSDLKEFYHINSK